jgi:hypothetical protein
MLRHRCEQSPVSPTESAARKRAAATAVAGEGVTQTGAEAPSPETPSGPQASLTHALVYMIQPRADARHPDAYRKPTGRYLDALHNACASKRRAIRDRSTRSTAPVLRRGRRSACCGHDRGSGPFAFCGGMPSPACASVLRIPPNGKQRCGGARSTCSGGQWDREVPPSRVSIRAFITNLVPQGSE